MKRILTLTLVATTLVGLGACGSDKKTSLPNVNDSSNITLPGGDTLVPSDLSFPGNVTEECQAIALQFAAVYTQAFSPEANQADLEKAFGDMSANVPDDLKDDLAVLLTAFSDYAKVVKDNGSDMTKPEVQAALAALTTPEVSAASDNITAYFDATCPS